jgi:hypothetical protein
VRYSSPLPDYCATHFEEKEKAVMPATILTSSEHCYLLVKRCVLGAMRVAT